MIQSAPLMLLVILMRSCPYNWRNHGPSGPFLSVEESMTKDELIARLQVLGSN